ncbi:right-handed parallel beta-helix repeat-containing protein, partial [bacterium]|nr:right-handed parallel beta-helix repeat-containing protein [bacterium]
MTGAYYGIFFENVDASAISGDSLSNNGSVGAYLLNSCDTNTLSDNFINSNSSYGVYAYVSSNITIKNNSANANGQYGIYFEQTSACGVSGNTVNSNNHGIFLASSNNNVISNNTIRSNALNGIDFNLGSGNAFTQNEISANDTGVRIYDASVANTFAKNNITGNTSSNWSSLVAVAQTLSRNWWGSTDSSAIKNKINDTASAWSPYRLGVSDTAAGADTTAPKAPDTVAVVSTTSDSTVVLEWSAVTALEESNGGAVGVSGYRVYRSTVKDTSSWTSIQQLASSITRFQDTDVVPGRVYYYRVTAFDAATLDNESFFSDSQPSGQAWVGRMNFYVNDASTSGDSFTTAAGSDVTGEGTVGKPFASLAKTMQYVTAGDTIWLDAGTFGSDTWEMISTTETAAVNLDTDNLTLIGKDSGATVIDPVGPKTQPDLNGIYASGRTGLTIKNLGVTGAYNGINFNNVDLSTISGDSVGSNGNAGILFTSGSDSNTVKNNTTSNNSQRGIDIQSSANNTVDNNIANSNLSIGIRFSTNASKNIVKNNTASSNSTYGIFLSSVTQTANFDIFNNTLTANPTGIGFSSAFSSTIRNNVIASSAEQGILIQSSDTNLVYQNEITGGDTGVRIEGSSANNIVSKNNITGSAVNSVYNSAGIAQTITRNWYGSADSVTVKAKISDTASAFSPYRIGVVDTTAGADTTAPKAPDTVGVIGAPSDTSVILEWSAVTVNEESVGGAPAVSGYRIYRAETKDTSSWVKVAQQTGIRYQDTDAVPGRVYYYRVTAFDAAAFPNESFYSDSQPSDSAAFTSRVNWYVNDASTSGDSYTYAAGSDVTGQGTAQKPFKSIPLAMRFTTAGDTIWLDAGIFDSYVISTSSDTAGVRVDKDNISLIGVDSTTTIIDPPGSTGAALEGPYGIYATNQTGLVVKNLACIGGNYGLFLNNVDQITAKGDSFSSNSDGGIFIYNSSDTAVIDGCAAVNNPTYGIYISGGNGHAVTNNVVKGASTGYSVQNSNSTYSGNLAQTNTTGFSLQNANFVMFKSNQAISNTGDGFYLRTSDTNTFVGNLSSGNVRGIQFQRSQSNILVQNQFSANTQYQIYLTYDPTGGASTNDSFSKNVISPSSSNPDSGVFNNTNELFGFERNWWGTTDSTTIKKMIFDTAPDLKIKFQPYRLGLVDTAGGADTTAPKAPDTVAVIGAPSDTSIIIEWSAVTALEESNGGAVGLSGYRVYRSTVKDTSSWTRIQQLASGITRYQDTDVALGTPYHYRVTAFDAAAFENESYFSDSQPSDSAAFTSRVNWYVNDASTAGDSYTSAAGSDVTGQGTAQKPFATITKALSLVTVGDTVFVDAGLFAETVVINADSISLIGKDSNATVIDPPGANSITTLYGVYATGRTGLLIKNLGVTGAYVGIRFNNVDQSTITSDSASATGQYGIYLLTGSDNNTISNNITNLNGYYGMFLQGSLNCTVSGNTSNSNTEGIELNGFSDNNTVRDNTTNSNNYGILLSQSSTNQLLNNTTLSNNRGIALSASSNNNLISSNIVKSSTASGIDLMSSSNNVFVQNTLVSNTEYQIYIYRQGIGTTPSDTFMKNVIIPSTSNPDSGVFNSTNNPQYFMRNWWGTTDSIAINKMIFDTATGKLIQFQPFRLGAVDTAAGADTTAPKAPDTVGVIGSPSDTSVILEWSAVTALEESNGGAGGLSGYRVYRSKTKDTSSWVKAGQTTGIRYQDTDVELGVNYFYRVTAFDAATPFENESFFSDSQPSDSAQAQSRVNWYVNDASTTGDSFTYLAGNDVTGQGTVTNPFATITRALKLATAGDTVWVDAGLYAETVVIGTDSISLIGKDSNATVIDPPGSIATTGLYGIYATGRTGLSIKSLGVTGASEGIRFDNVDLSTITGDSVSANGLYGIYLLSGSNNNTVSSNQAIGNTNDNIVLNGSSNNTVSSNAANSASSSNGIYLTTNADTNTVSSNTANSNGVYGIQIQSSFGNTLNGNTTGSNTVDGIRLSASSNNTISNNTVNSNLSEGIMLASPSNNNTISDNTANSNGGQGIYLNGSSNNVISSNSLTSNSQRGIVLATNADTNIVRNNVVRSSAWQGMWIKDADFNLVVQNDVSGGDTGIHFEAASTLNTASKNNITGSAVNFIYNQSGNPQTLSRNWFGSTDTAAIKSKISDAVSAWQPHRLGLVDTTAGADTTAPKAPDTVAVTPSDTSMIVEWTAVTTNEESNGGPVALSQYRIYRSETKDTSSWVKVAKQTGIRYQDTDVVPGRIYYYRVTAFDTVTLDNESFFSDSQPSDSASFTSRVNWYVNDAATAGDSYTYAAGSDVTGQGTAQKPFKSIPLAMRFATAGDTIFLDAGLYDSYVIVNSTETAGVNIDKDQITLIGKDSGATVIDPPGPKTLSGLYGIYATNRVELRIRNLGITGAYEGIQWSNVDNSTLDGDSICSNGDNGIYFTGGSDTNTVKNSTLGFNSFDGFYINSGSNITLSNNTATSNTGNGLSIVGCNQNTVTGNTTKSNTYGIHLSNASNNAVSGNTASSNTRGINLAVGANANVISRNVCASNTQGGVQIDSSDTNTVALNECSGNADGVKLSSSSKNNTVTKNNLAGNSTTGLANPGGLAQSLLTRNWFGSADSVTVAAKISDTANAWSPYRLALVDTAAGADTTAPKAPDTIAIIGTPSDTSVILEWSAVTALEESNGGAVGLSGYRVYRSKTKDTSSWVKAGQTTGIRYQDTDVELGVNYFYRVTAFDAATPFENESFFSDSQPSDSAQAQSRVNWYVNDASTAGDSYTYAAGSDVTGLGTPQSPFGTVAKAMTLATAGDTVWLDAGLYAEAVVIAADQISLIGVDSNATVIDPPGNDTGIYASARTGLLIKTLGVRSTNYGILFDNVDFATISGDSFSNSTVGGVHLTTGSDSNTVEKCDFARNSTGGGSVYALLVSGHGNTLRQNRFVDNVGANIIVSAPAQNNLVEANHLTGGTYGIWLNQTNAFNNRVLGNTLVKQSNIAIPLDTTDSNVIARNVVQDNGQTAGLPWRALNLFNSHGNVVVQNTFDSVAGYAIYVDGNSAGNVITKNQFPAGTVFPDSGAFNNTTSSVDAARNFWGTTDESSIRGRFRGPGADTITFSPYRLGAVDTASGADTTAPGLPASVTLDTTSVASAIMLTWVIPTINEETNGGAVGFSGVNIWRSTQPDTNNWANSANLVKQTASTDTTWTDTNVSLAVTYYYRLTSKDGAVLLNESFFTDTKWAAPALAANVSGVWYVNDAGTAGDSFTSATGNDVTGNGTAQNPYRTITKAVSQVKAGDTIYVDAGLYSETVVIDTDYVSLIGKDSVATVIDPPGAKTTVGLYGIYADTQTGLTIKNLGVTGAYDGIHFYNVDNSTIESDSVSSNGHYGIYVRVNSDTNTIKNNTASSNTNSSIYLDTSSNNTVTNNTVTSNTPSSNAYGIRLSSSSNNTVTSNTASSNLSAGIYLSSNSNNNTVTSNTASLNSTFGIALYSNSNNNTVTSNTASSNSDYGIYLDSSSNNTVTSNTVTSNLDYGIYLYGSSNNTVTSNTASSNSLGIILDTSSNNTVTSNTVSSNSFDGIWLSSSSNNTVVQNDVRNNTEYQIYIDGAPSSDTVVKNDIKTSGTNPDSGVYNGSSDAASKFTFTRNWWNSTDTDRIKKMIFQASNGDSIIWQPFRLGQVDTAAGADTTAPAKPDTVTLDTSTPGQIVVAWQNPTTLEEANGGAVGFAGVKVYRLKDTPDTTHWANALVWTAGAGDTMWIDTQVVANSVYYYRLTSRDAAASVNESFFTDTTSQTAQPSSFTLSAPNGGQVWTVGDTQTLAWSTVGTVANVKIEFSTDSGATFPNVITPSVSNTGSYAWNVADSIGSGVRIRITDVLDAAIFDTSNANFTIRGGFTLTSPNGGDSIQSPGPFSITWLSTGTISASRLDYSTDSGVTWSVITPSVVNTGVYSWTVPNVSTTQAKVRVSDTSDAAVNDTSNDVFQI